MEKNKKHRSFSAELSLHILLVFSSLFAATIIFSSVFSNVLITSEAKQSAKNLHNSTINEIERVLSRVEALAQSTVWIVEENKDDREYMYHITRKLVEENEIIGSAVAFDKYYFPGEYYYSPYSYVAEDGSIRSKQLGNSQYDYFSMDWFLRPYELGSPCWSEPYFDEGGGSSLMTTYSCPIKTSSGSTYAILTADVSLDWLSGIISQIKPYPNSSVQISSASGSYISVSDERSPDRNETILSNAQKLGNKSILRIAEDISSGREGIAHYFLNGKKYFSVYGSLSNGWSLCITCGYGDVLSKATLMTIIMIVIGLLGLAAAFFFTYRSIKSITRPLSLFCESAMSIAGGNFNTPLPEIPSDDEISKLRDSFDFMQHALTDYIAQLKDSIATNERYESELSIASKIQIAMLPVNFPKTQEVDLHAYMKPARQVGGDLYDFTLKGDSTLYFAVGDVSGKGIPASIFMAITRASFHFFGGLNLTLSQIMERMNRFMCDGNDRNMFVTLFIGKLDLKTGLLQFCNAGHNPPVLVGSSNKAEYLAVKPNLALGVFPDFSYEMQEITLSEGDRMLLYTDGVTEAERKDKSQFGEAKLLEWTEQCCKTTSAAGDVCSSLYGAVNEFTCGNEQNDDITIMAIKYR